MQYMQDIVHVLVAAKINKPLAYKSGHLDTTPQVGALVRVPLGKREVTGIVCDSQKLPSHENKLKENNSTLRLKAVSEILSDEISVPADLLALLSWCQRYYHTAIGQVVSAALPKSILGGKPAEDRSKRLWKATLDDEEISAISAPKQKELLQWLQKNQPCQLSEMIDAGFGRHLITALQKNNFIELSGPSFAERTQSGSDDEFAELLKATPKILNTEQKAAVDHIYKQQQDKKDKQPFYLLNGVTGSGKTEVYLQVTEKHLHSNGKVLVLVPEIGLIEQTAARFKNRFDVELLTYHSDTPESEKIECWKRSRKKAPLIIIGTRSSIFLPFSDLSLIVVDEEQDLSYKQQEGFRYSARDLSIIRATEQNATLILGSATPSLESLNNAKRGLLKPLYLKSRIGDRPLPNWQFSKPASRDSNSPISSAALQSIDGELKKGNQVLVFINRRGFAPLLQCTQCGWQAKCSACETSMTLHMRPSILICHRCDHRQAVPQKCPDCQSTHLRSQGLGTEQIERFLQNSFSGITCLRIDRDSTQRKGSFSEKLATLKEGSPAILVGTQMITKGHHLPGISLVVVLEADAVLISHDFRSLEHMAQSLTQVAGRAGRGQTPGQILVETSQPDHPVFQALSNSSYEEFSGRLLEARQSQNLPPFYFSALLHASSTDLHLLSQFMENCRQQLQLHISRINDQDEKKPDKIGFIGPMPSPVEKRNNRFRYQIQIYANSRSQLHLAVSAVEQLVDSMKGFGKIRFGIDIDPLTMD